jgi:hypothetical protein
MQNEMRTDTAWVIYSPGYRTEPLTEPGKEPKVALTGHVGAVGYRFLPDDNTRWLQIHQDEWHQDLRDAFDAGDTPSKVVGLMAESTKTSVWKGDTPGAVSWLRYYVKESEGGGPLTLGELGEEQVDRYNTLIAQFEHWKTKWVKKT